MEFVFGILGVLCLLYYGIIILYSGLATSFSSIWPILAGCLFLMAAACRAYRLFGEKIPLRLTVSAVTVTAAFFVIFVIVEILMGLNFFSLKKYSADYCIVLGAQVRGNEASNSLRYRLEMALEYARIHPNTVFILSGGQGKGENLSEAELMYQYLLENGVPEYQLIKEEQSYSTYENMVYSKLLIDAREAERRTTIRNIMAEAGYLVPPDDEVTIRVAVLTSNFHVMRAKGIARSIGIPNVSGIAAKSDPVLFIHFCVRECFAILKDKFMGNM
ncbi:MAG: YdcF family protein [Lachnospiraceae bacterium]|nr:YdcF family protein [Lachnospiraceae bacterium]